MAKLTLSNIADITGNPTSAATAINNNSDAIETALENTISRDGTSPNSMSADLDLNGNDILNVGSISVNGVNYVSNVLDTLGFVDFTEIVAPSAPSTANKARLYAVDSGGTTKLEIKDSSANTHDLTHFTQAGTGATLRTQQTKLREVVSILDFGGVADGVTNNATALATAFAALSGTGGTIYFPSGKYAFSSSVTLTMPSGLFSVGIMGDGADTTVLYWPTTAGLVIACSNARHSVHVRDLSITTGTTNAGSGLKLTNSVLLGVIMQSDVTGVTFRGNDGGSVSNYWTIGCEVIGLSQITFDSDLFYGASGGALGTGLSVKGNSVTSPNYGIVYNLDKCTFYTIGIGLQYDTYIQGVTVDQCNFVNGTTGIFQPSSTVGFAQLAVSNSNFDCTGNNVLLQSPVTAISFVNNNFYIPTSGVGISMSSTGFGNTFVGNNFNGETASSSTKGILVSGNVTNSTCIGNNFYNLTTAIDVGGTSTWTIEGNNFNTVTNPLLNIGTNKVGLEFYTGSGGTVTQATSKSTTVTLNKRCGQITTNNAALGAGASVVFNMQNTTIAATDSIIVGIQGGGTANVYEANVVAISASGCNIKLTNTSGGSLGEAPVINFMVIKGVAA